MILQEISLHLQTIYPLIIAVLHYGLPLILFYLFGKHQGIKKHIEIECQELTDKLQKISKQLPGVVYQFRLNPDGSSCFPYASDAIKEIYRVTPQDVQHNADKVFSLLHFEDFERISRSIVESAKNLTPWVEEYRVKFDDGTVRWLHGNALPQREADGSTLWHGFITDITDKKRIEIDYKSVVDASFNGFVSVDFSGHILSVNQVYCDILGYSEHELLNMGINDFDVLETPEETAEHLNKILQTGYEQFETKQQRKDGTIIDVAVSVIFLQALGQRLFAFIKDITTQKQFEARLLESEFRWKFAIEGSGDGLWDWDIGNDTVFFSKRWKEMIGFDEYELENTFDVWKARIHPDDKEKVFSILHDYFAERIPVYLIEHRLKCKDGSYKWILARGTIVRRGKNNEPLRMIGTNTDINQRKNIEQELQRSNSDLEQFAYAVSHDMRQPLRMVTSYLGLIESALQKQLDEETRTFLHFAIDGAKRMDGMILSLLDYSRVGRQTDPFTLISSRACIDEVLIFLKPDLKNTGGVIEITGDWIDFIASRDEITRLLQNLIGNAFKYHDENKPPHIKVNASVIENNMFRVEVHDNGIGINPSQMERLFKVFSRLQPRSRFDGTGVGLALCRKIVEHHDGRIGVNSNGEGCGCTFWFELPIKEISL